MPAATATSLLLLLRLNLFTCNDCVTCGCCSCSILAYGRVAPVATTLSRLSRCMQLVSAPANRPACWLLVQQISRRSWLLVHGVSSGRSSITRTGSSFITCTCSSLFRCDSTCYWLALPASSETVSLQLMQRLCLLLRLCLSLCPAAAAVLVAVPCCLSLLTPPCCVLVVPLAALM